MGTTIARIYFAAELEEAEDCDVFAVAVDDAADTEPPASVIVAIKLASDAVGDNEVALCEDRAENVELWPLNACKVVNGVGTTVVDCDVVIACWVGTMPGGGTTRNA